VIRGKYPSSAMKSNELLHTLDKGNALYYNKFGNRQTLGGSLVSIVDIPAQNGVIHTVDRLLTPPAGPAIQALESRNDFTFLRRLLANPKFSTELVSLAPFTMFAPNDRAFSALPEDKRLKLLTSFDAFRSLVKAHTVRGIYPVRIFGIGPNMLQAVDGSSVSVDVTADLSRVSVNGAQLVETDLFMNNGVVHVVDKLFPGNVKK